MRTLERSRFVAEGGHSKKPTLDTVVSVDARPRAQADELIATLGKALDEALAAKDEVKQRVQAEIDRAAEIEKGLAKRRPFPLAAGQRGAILGRVIERIVRMANSFEEAAQIDREDVAAMSFEERISGVERLRRVWFIEDRAESRLERILECADLPSRTVPSRRRPRGGRTRRAATD